MFSEILERELLKMRLCECDFVHSHSELSIHPGMQIEKRTIKNQRRQPGETRDTSTRASRTTKKARADVSARGYKRASQGEASVFIYIPTLSRVLSARLYSRQYNVISMYMNTLVLGVMGLSVKEASFIVEYYFHSSLYGILQE